MVHIRVVHIKKSVTYTECHNLSQELSPCFEDFNSFRMIPFGEIENQFFVKVAPMKNMCILSLTKSTGELVSGKYVGKD